MATTFVPKPTVSAVQLCGRVILRITGKGKNDKHFAGLKDGVLAMEGLVPARKKNTGKLIFSLSSHRNSENSGILFGIGD